MMTTNYKGFSIIIIKMSNEYVAEIKWGNAENQHIVTRGDCDFYEAESYFLDDCKKRIDSLVEFVKGMRA